MKFVRSLLLLVTLIGLGQLRSAQAFTVSAGERLLFSFDQLNYVDTIHYSTQTDPGSLSSLFIDVVRSSFDPGDVFSVTVYKGTFPGTPANLVLGLAPRIGDAAQAVGEMDRYAASSWAENVQAGWLELRVDHGAVDLAALTFQNSLNAAAYPRGPVPGDPLDYHVYRFEVVSVPEPKLVLAIAAGVGFMFWWRSRRKLRQSI